MPDEVTTTDDLSPIQQAIESTRQSDDSQWGTEPEDLGQDPNALPPDGTTDDSAETTEAPGMPSEEAEVPEGEEGATTPEGEQPPSPEDEDETFVFQLPSREPDGDPIEIETSDKNVAERMNQMYNGYRRSEQIKADRQELSQMQEEFAEVEMFLRNDPVNFIMEGVAPEIKKDLALNLLADPEVYSAVTERVDEWERDASVKEASQARMETDRIKRKDQVRDTITYQRAAREQSRGIEDTLQSMIPATLSQGMATQFLADARGDVKRFLESRKIEVINPADLPRFLNDIPTILSNRLRLYGIGSEPGNKGQSAPPSTTPSVARPASPEAQRLAEEAKATPNRVRAAVRNRKEAAAVPSAGAGGAVPEPGAPPKGAGVKDAIKGLRAKGWVRGTKW